ncbi:YceI family protein [Siphonobacter sp.]|uniref:YceI family protein n=1 Tax=Siphonobacter sp. TaxID=1869184 RepID=UPI003B3B6437
MATPAKWVIDPTHSEVQFKVKHLVITTVTGQFSQFSGEATASDDFSDAQVHFEAEIDSISTNNEARDGHLKSEDFFAAEQHPKLSFVSTGISKKGDEEFVLNGDLTIRGVTKPVAFAVEYGGTVVDPYGQTKAGFEVKGKINRKDYGLTWSAVTEAGGAVVSDEVRLIANVQFVKQA